MLVFTPHGYNMFELMILQLYNWHVDSDFMGVWCPFHSITELGIYVAMLTQNLRWNTAWCDMARANKRAQSRQRRLAGSPWTHWPPLNDRGWNHSISTTLEFWNVCSLLCRPCHCSRLFPRAAEVWTGWTTPDPQMSAVKGCFVYEMWQEYNHRMGLIKAFDFVHFSVACRKCPRARLKRWSRRLYLRLVRRLLRLNLSFNEDLVDRVMSC